MKYSLAGHSCVEEVDNMQKQIEDASFKILFAYFIPKNAS